MFEIFPLEIKRGEFEDVINEHVMSYSKDKFNV